MFSLIACCQELDVSFSGPQDEYLWTTLGQYLQGTWSVGGTVNDFEYYSFQDTFALWHVPDATPYWILGPMTELGGTSQFNIAAIGPSSKFVGKCPNNHGQIQWSWNYGNAEGGLTPSNEIHIKCASEGDFCTSTNPCGSEQGDCDSHDECQTGLTCGLDNCGITEEPDMDCCYAATIGDDMFCTTVNNFSIIFKKSTLMFFEFLSQFLTCG